MSALSESTMFPVVAVIGAGQLARMMQPAAVALGVRLRLLATDPEESAAQVVPDVLLGAPDDEAALRRRSNPATFALFLPAA